MPILHRVFLFRLIAPIAIALTLLFTCRIAEDDPLPERRRSIETVIESTPMDEPFVRFVFGSAAVLSGNEERRVETGDGLRHGDVVSLEQNAVVELQYADAALARVEGPADFEIRLHRRSDVTVLTIMLDNGATIVRREPNTADRSIRVRTDGGIVESDGTSFLVEHDQAGTRVQVASGRVRVLPSPVDPDELRAATEIEEVLAAIDEISDSAVFVDADGSVLLRPQDVQTAGELLRDMQEQLSTFGVTSVPSAEDVATIQAVLRYARDRIRAATPDVGRITVAERSRIEQGSSRPILPIDREASNPSGGLPRLRIETDPAGAEVYLDGVNVGNEIFSALFEPGETATVEVRAAGYVSRRFEVDFEPDLDESLIVVLERRQPTISADRLFQAVRRGDNSVVRTWIEEGGSPDVTDDSGRTVLSVAFGATSSLAELLGEFRPNAETIDILLSAGADPDVVFDVGASSFTPLTATVLSGLFRDRVNYELIERLLDAGASVDIVVETGEMRVTALALPVIIGIERGEVDLVLIDLLIDAGSNANATVFYDGRLLNPLTTALVLGAEFSYDPAAVVYRLARAGARVRDRVRIGGTVWTPIEFAREAGLSESVEVLLEFSS